MLGLSCSRWSKSEIDFYAENVIIDIRGDRVHVTGKYFFQNRSSLDKKVTIYYPFPVDSVHAYPDVIMLDRSFHKDPGGIYFDISIPARTVDSFKILYQQKLNARHCRYITSTTRHWRRPLKTAAFTVVAPVDIKLIMNYPVTGAEVINDTAFYYIRLKNFYPLVDLKIQW